MDSVKAEDELTSTVDNVMSTSNKEEKSDSSDATPTSSTDANTNPTASRTVSDDPISSTSSDIFDQKAPTMSQQAVDETDKTHPPDQVNELLDILDTDEKVTEDVEDLVHDLESLLGEASEPFNLPQKPNEMVEKKLPNNVDLQEVGKSADNNLNEIIGHEIVETEHSENILKGKEEKESLAEADEIEPCSVIQNENSTDNIEEEVTVTLEEGAEPDNSNRSTKNEKDTSQSLDDDSMGSWELIEYTDMPEKEPLVSSTPDDKSESPSNTQPSNSQNIGEDITSSGDKTSSSKERQDSEESREADSVYTQSVDETGEANEERKDLVNEGNNPDKIEEHSSEAEALPLTKEEKEDSKEDHTDVESPMEISSSEVCDKSKTLEESSNQEAVGSSDNPNRIQDEEKSEIHEEAEKDTDNSTEDKGSSVESSEVSEPKTETVNKTEDVEESTKEDLQSNAEDVCEVESENGKLNGRNIGENIPEQTVEANTLKSSEDRSKSEDATEGESSAEPQNLSNAHKKELESKSDTDAVCIMDPKPPVHGAISENESSTSTIITVQSQTEVPVTETKNEVEESARTNEGSENPEASLETVKTAVPNELIPSNSPKFQPDCLQIGDGPSERVIENMETTEVVLSEKSSDDKVLAKIESTEPVNEIVAAAATDSVQEDSETTKSVGGEDIVEAESQNEPIKDVTPSISSDSSQIGEDMNPGEVLVSKPDKLEAVSKDEDAAAPLANKGHHEESEDHEKLSLDGVEAVEEKVIEPEEEQNDVATNENETNENKPEDNIESVNMEVTDSELTEVTPQPVTVEIKVDAVEIESKETGRLIDENTGNAVGNSEEKPDSMETQSKIESECGSEVRIEKIEEPVQLEASESKEDVEYTDSTETKRQNEEASVELTKSVENEKNEAEAVDNEKNEAESIENEENKDESVENEDNEGKSIENEENEVKCIENEEKEATSVENEPASVENDENEAKFVENEAESVENDENEAKSIENEKEAKSVENETKCVENEAESVENDENEAKSVENEENAAKSVEIEEMEAKSVENEEVEAKFVEYEENEAKSIENEENATKSVEHEEMEAKFVENEENEARSVGNEEMEAKSVKNEKVEAKSVENEENEGKSVKNEKVEAKSVENEENEGKSIENEDNEEKSIGNEENEAKLVENEENEAKSIENEENEAKSIENEENEVKSIENENEAETVVETSDLVTTDVEKTVCDKMDTEEIQSERKEIEKVEEHNKTTVDINSHLPDFSTVKSDVDSQTLLPNNQNTKKGELKTPQTKENYTEFKLNNDKRVAITAEKIITKEETSPASSESQEEKPTTAQRISPKKIPDLEFAPLQLSEDDDSDEETMPRLVLTPEDNVVSLTEENDDRSNDNLQQVDDILEDKHVIVQHVIPPPVDTPENLETILAVASLQNIDIPKQHGNITEKERKEMEALAIAVQSITDTSSNSYIDDYIDPAILLPNIAPEVNEEAMEVIQEPIVVEEPVESIQEAVVEDEPVQCIQEAVVEDVPAESKQEPVESIREAVVEDEAVVDDEPVEAAESIQEAVVAEEPVESIQEAVVAEEPAEAIQGAVVLEEPAETIEEATESIQEPVESSQEGAVADEPVESIEEATESIQESVESSQEVVVADEPVESIKEATESIQEPVEASQEAVVADESVEAIEEATESIQEAVVVDEPVESIEEATESIQEPVESSQATVVADEPVESIEEATESIQEPVESIQEAVVAEEPVECVQEAAVSEELAESIQKASDSTESIQVPVESLQEALVANEPVESIEEATESIQEPVESIQEAVVPEEPVECIQEAVVSEKPAYSIQKAAETIEEATESTHEPVESSQEAVVADEQVESIQKAAESTQGPAEYVQETLVEDEPVESIQEAVVAVVESTQEDTGVEQPVEEIVSENKVINEVESVVEDTNEAEPVVEEEKKVEAESIMEATSVEDGVTILQEPIVGAGTIEAEIDLVNAEAESSVVEEGTIRHINNDAEDTLKQDEVVSSEETKEVVQEAIIQTSGPVTEPLQEPIVETSSAKEALQDPVVDSKGGDPVLDLQVNEDGLNTSEENTGKKINTQEETSTIDAPESSKLLENNVGSENAALEVITESPTPSSEENKEDANVSQSDISKSDKEIKSRIPTRKHRKSEKLEELTINVDVPDREKTYSPKVTIKPIKVPDEEVSTTTDSESKGSLKMTITKQSDNMHSILKISDQENSEVADEPDEPIPKLIIKPKIQQVEQQHSPKMSTRSSKHSPTSSNQRSGSPRITIKPVVKQEQPVSPLKIKINTKANSKVATKEEETAKKLSIKSVVKPVEEPEQLQSPRITIKPIPKPESEKEANPRLTIKPVKKPEEDVENEDKERCSPKIIIKPIVKPQETEVVTPSSQQDEDEIKERIVLKINKGNLPHSPVKETKKKEHSSDEDKSEKLAKITVKFSKGGGHPHIVHQQGEEPNPKRPHEETVEKNKKQKVEVETVVATRSKHKEHDVIETKTNPGPELRTKHKDHSIESPIETKRTKKDNVNEKPKVEVEVSVIESKIDSPIVISEDSRSQDSGSVIILDDVKEDSVSSVDVPKYISKANLSSGESATQSPVPRKRGRPRKSLPVDLERESATPSPVPKKKGRPRKTISPAIEIEMKETSTENEIVVCETATPSPIQTTPSPVIKKKGRPRKIVADVQEETKVTEDSKVTNSNLEVHESGRPKRSCRGQSVCDKLGIKPRKSRGSGRGRGSLRGVGNRSFTTDRDSSFEIKLEDIAESSSKSHLENKVALTADIEKVNVNNPVIVIEDTNTKTVEKGSIPENIIIEIDSEDSQSSEITKNPKIKPVETVEAHSTEVKSVGLHKEPLFVGKLSSAEPNTTFVKNIVDEKEVVAEKERPSVKTDVDSVGLHKEPSFVGTLQSAEPSTSFAKNIVVEKEVAKKEKPSGKTDDEINKKSLINVESSIPFSILAPPTTPKDFSQIGTSMTSSQIIPLTKPSDPEISSVSSTTVPSEIMIVDEDTRMSADTSSRAQTPAKQVVTSSDIVEESQSSVHSNGTTESGKTPSRPSKAPRLEVQDSDSVIVTADHLSEYYWNGNGPFMLQEQVAHFLGIKSFKRKYPGIMRRMLDMQERDYIREQGLASEHMCDLGLTAVNAADILDIMYSDFQDKYEEYCKHQRDRQAKELISKQKALSLAATQEKCKADITEQAVHSAAQWNVRFNKARREQRRTCMDLQNLTVHYPKGKTVPAVTDSHPGDYPVALVPGQFGEYFEEFTPTELNNLPINTMCYDPVNFIPRDETDDSGSEDSDSDTSGSSSSSSDSDSSSGIDDCKLCKQSPKKMSPVASPSAVTISPIVTK